MAKSLVAFLTDFGTRDHYVGVMKGVVLGVNPEATLVDLSHDLPPYDVAFAAQELSATCRYFPPGTIFLVVVDPGVGTDRRGIAAEAGSWRCVAPDNGVLTSVFDEYPPRKVVELTERR
jgi:S-adenosylmethionine hydrolase